MEKLLPTYPLEHVHTIIKQYEGMTITVIVILRDKDGDLYKMMDNQTLAALKSVRIPKMPLGLRVQKSDLPRQITACPTTKCIYNQGGFCDDPQINKGNSDAKCFRMSNKALLELLIGKPKKAGANLATVMSNAKVTVGLVGIHPPVDKPLPDERD